MKTTATHQKKKPRTTDSDLSVQTKGAVSLNRETALFLYKNQLEKSLRTDDFESNRCQTGELHANLISSSL